MVRTQRAGVTVIELTVVFTLMLGLLALVVLYFVKGQQYVADNEAYSNLQRQVMTVMGRLKQELNRSTSQHLETDDPDSTYVFFLSYYNDDPAQPSITFGPGGQIVWRKWVCFFHDDTNKEIIHAEIPLDTPTASVTTKPPPDVDSTSFVGAKSKVVGRQVEQVNFSKFGDSVLITLVVRGESPVALRKAEDKVIEIRLNSQINLIN